MDRHLASSILISDRRTLTRELLAHYLADSRPSCSISTAEGPIAALRLLETATFDFVVARCEPHGLDGMSLVGEIKKRKLLTRSIIIGRDSAGRMELLRALHAGARGYLSPEDGLSDLSAALDVVARNIIYVSEQTLGEHDLTDLIVEARDLKPSPFDWLTLREREILHLIGRGLTSSRIAERLSVSLHTVEGHRATLMTKTRCHSVADLLHWISQAELLAVGHPIDPETGEPEASAE